jgi:hypothetical protein
LGTIGSLLFNDLFNDPITVDRHLRIIKEKRNVGLNPATFREGRLSSTMASRSTKPKGSDN